MIELRRWWSTLRYISGVELPCPTVPDDIQIVWRWVPSEYMHLLSTKRCLSCFNHHDKHNHTVALQNGKITLIIHVYVPPGQEFSHCCAVPCTYILFSAGVVAMPSNAKTPSWRRMYILERAASCLWTRSCFWKIPKVPYLFTGLTLLMFDTPILNGYTLNPPRFFITWLSNKW